MPRRVVNLPDPAVQNIPGVALQHLPPKLLNELADPGIYSDSGLFGLGAGWYHTGTSADQIFLGHPGAADFYVLDFDVMADGTARAQGVDIITQFERALDGVVALNSFALIAPGVSISTEAQGTGPQDRFEDGVDYSLIHLEFVDGQPLRTELADLGGLRFADIV